MPTLGGDFFRYPDGHQVLVTLDGPVSTASLLQFHASVGVSPDDTLIGADLMAQVFAGTTPISPLLTPDDSGTPAEPLPVAEVKGRAAFGQFTAPPPILPPTRIHLQLGPSPGNSADWTF